ncbi:MAG TPA: tetratricopeptide repeat protein, partial [Polyangiales bacterium]|nr:tetratricopeptide repeat protein [Polyangiales bacterium]
DHYRRVSDFPSLANLISGYASYTTNDQEAAAAYREVADLLANSLGDPKRAEGYYRRAVQRDPRNLDAFEGLQALLARANRLPELTELITAQLDLLERQKADPRDIAVLCYRLGELWSKHFDRADEALAHYRRAYELDPRLLRAIYEARLLYLARGDRRSAAALYEKEASAEPEPARKQLLLRELGSLYVELDDRDGAVSALDRARGIAPNDIELAHLLAAQLLERSRTMDERTRMTDLDRVASLLCEIASALPDDEAVAFLESALSHAPWHAQALSDLERRTPPALAGQKLAPYWVAYLTHNPDGERADDRRIALARAYATAGQIEDAVFCVTPAAERRVPAALQLLAELRGEAPASEREPRSKPKLKPKPTLDNEHEHERETARPKPPPTTRPAPARTAGDGPDFVTQISDMNELHALREAARSVDSLADIGEPDESRPPRVERASHEPRAHTTPVDRDAMDVAVLHREMAAMVAQQRAHEAADVAQRILLLDPLDAEAFSLLDRHFRRERDFAARAELLMRSAQSEGLPIPTRKQRLREAANLFETRVSDVDAALTAHRELVALEPDNDELMRALRRLLERAQRWDELVQLLEDEAKKTSDVQARSTFLKRAAEVHRRERGDRDSAARVLGQLIELDAEDRAARLALTEDLIALERFDDAVKLLERRIEETTSRPERLPLLRQLGTLLETRIGDKEAAFAVYERVLEIVPDDTQALDRMEEIDDASGAHERKLKTLARRAEHATAPQAADIFVRMATVAEADLLDKERAAELLRKALSLAPSNLQILMALSNLYERAGLNDELLALLRERAVAEKNTKARTDIQRRIGRLLSQRMDDDAGAEAAFAKVLEAGEDREALVFMEKRARERNDGEALA